MEAGNWFHRSPLFCLMSDLDGILLGQRKRERKLRKEIKTERKVGGRKRNVSESLFWKKEQWGEIRERRKKKLNRDRKTEKVREVR